MKKLIRLALVAVAFTLVLTALPVKPTEVAAQGGGIIIDSSFGAGLDTLHPFYCNDTGCLQATGLLYVGLGSVDPETGTFAESGVFVAGGITESYEVLDGGATVVYHLRQDVTWNDGTPITARDVLYAWNAINTPEAEVVNAGLYMANITNVEAPDDYTVVFTMTTASCDALWDAGVGTIAPSHILGEDLAALPAGDYALNPTVTAGPFRFQELRVADQVTLLRDEAWFDAPEGGVAAEGYIIRVVPDQTVQVEQLLAGDLTWLDGPPVARRAEIRERGDAGTLRVYSFPGNSWDYLGLNFADPTNPQNGLDEDGNPIPQGEHPLFSDLAVRRALALAIDVDSIISSAVFGEGTRMAANMIPTSWAVDPDLEPLPFDPDEAAALLDEAGWVVGADGIREKDGVRFSFTLYTNQGNTRRQAIGEIVRDQLRQIGVEVDFQTIDFNVLVDRMRSQTLDAFILGWRNGFPVRPDQTQLFTRANDTVGTGSNYLSWSNPRLDELMEQAKTVPSCATEERAAIYHEIQRLFQEDLPYIPMFVINGMYVAQSGLEGFDPRPNLPRWNIETWTIAQ